MRNSFIKTVHALAREDNRILVLAADNGAIVFDDFRRECPGRFINIGIAEAAMASLAAGMASCGKIPFTYTIIPFLLMRAFEQVRNDICMPRMNVKCVGIGAGLTYGALGPTHHAIEDIALVRALPGMTILSPADPLETGKATEAAAALDGPVYLRLGGSKESAVYEKDYAFRVGEGVTLRHGKDLAIIGTGSILVEALGAADRLEQQGIGARVINIHTLRPLDADLVARAAAGTGAVVTVEEHSVNGGLGEAVAAVLLERGLSDTRFRRIGIGDHFCKGYGPREYMLKQQGLDAESIAETARALLNPPPSTP